jgi:hypothetical protein
MRWRWVGVWVWEGVGFFRVLLVVAMVNLVTCLALFLYSFLWASAGLVEGVWRGSRR